MTTTESRTKNLAKAKGTRDSSACMNQSKLTDPSNRHSTQRLWYNDDEGWYL